MNEAVSEKLSCRSSSRVESELRNHKSHPGLETLVMDILWQEDDIDTALKVGIIP